MARSSTIVLLAAVALGTAGVALAETAATPPAAGASASVVDVAIGWLVEAWTWTDTTPVDELQARVAHYTDPAVLAHMQRTEGSSSVSIRGHALSDRVVRLDVHRTIVTPSAGRQVVDQVVQVAVDDGIVTEMVVIE